MDQTKNKTFSRLSLASFCLGFIGLVLVFYSCQPFLVAVCTGEDCSAWREQQYVLAFLLPLIVGSLLMGASFVLFGFSLAKKEPLNRLLFWLSTVSSLLGIGYSILCFALTASRAYTFYLQLVYPVLWLVVLIFGFVYTKKKVEVTTSGSQKA